MTTYALSKRYEQIENCIESEVVIEDPITGKTINTIAIWDTGAMASVITKEVSEVLGISPSGSVPIKGVSGEYISNTYFVKITLNNENITVKRIVAESESISYKEGRGLLIGMDIISLGDFIITNHKGKTVMSFRVPSIEKIDFCDDLREANKYLRIYESRKKHGNEKCPCGSNKLFKNCHGKYFIE